MTRHACQSERSNCQGAFSNEATFLPRRPLTSIRCRGKPAAGTTSFSMPRGVPSQWTLYPRLWNSCAQARAGNTCPPVPPAMISTLAFTDDLLGQWRLGKVILVEFSVFATEHCATFP